VLNQNPGPRADNNERRNTMAKYNLVSYNTATPNQKSPFSDLVSNLQLFNKAYDGKDKDKLLHKLPFWSDNSNYNSYPTIDDVIKNFNPKTSLDQTFVCRVRDDQIWSSDFTLGGFDRATQTNDKSCRNNLNTKKYGEDRVKGFNDDDSGTLNAYIRYQVKKDGTIDLICVKNMGNHRFWMKKLAAAGGPTEHLMKIRFHEGMPALAKFDLFGVVETSNPLKQAKMITIEAAAHHADAGDRNTQVEGQKFYSGLTAKIPAYVDCFDFLLANKINYKGIMQVKGVKDCENWPEISSITGLNLGKGNGSFKTYGTDNVLKSIAVARRIAMEITKEPIIMNSSIKCFGGMYKSLTELHDGITKSLFSKEQLSDFFYDFFKENNRKSKFRRNSIKLKMLTQSGSVKDFNYVSANMFWRDGAIVEYFRDMTDRDNGFTTSHKCMVHFLNNIHPLIRPQATVICTV